MTAKSHEMKKCKHYKNPLSLLKFLFITNHKTAKMLFQWRKKPKPNKSVTTSGEQNHQLICSSRKYRTHWNSFELIKKKAKKSIIISEIFVKIDHTWITFIMTKTKSWWKKVSENQKKKKLKQTWAATRNKIKWSRSNTPT